MRIFFWQNSDGPLEKKIMKLMLDEEKLPLTITEGFMNVRSSIINKNEIVYIHTHTYIYIYTWFR